jgi:hypothetical protein
MFDKLYTPIVTVSVTLGEEEIPVRFHSLNLFSAFFTVELFLLKSLSKDRQQLIEYKNASIEEKLNNYISEFLKNSKDEMLSSIKNLIFEYTNYAKIRKILEEHCIDAVNFELLDQEPFLTLFTGFLLKSMDNLNNTYSES